MSATAANYQELQDLIESSPHDEGDGPTLREHSQPAPGVHVAERPRRCASCREEMPCRVVRRLAAEYKFTDLMHVTEPGSVVSETGAAGPTGVTMRDHEL